MEECDPVSSSSDKRDYCCYRGDVGQRNYLAAGVNTEQSRVADADFQKHCRPAEKKSNHSKTIVLGIMTGSYISRNKADVMTARQKFSTSFLQFSGWFPLRLPSFFKLEMQLSNFKSVA